MYKIFGPNCVHYTVGFHCIVFWPKGQWGGGGVHAVQARTPAISDKWATQEGPSIKVKGRLHCCLSTHGTPLEVIGPAYLEIIYNVTFID